MKAIEHLPADHLAKVLRYEPETGLLFWLPRTEETVSATKRPASEACRAWNAKFSGKEAFTATSKGYRVGRVNNILMRAHRVAWAIYHGAWPSHDLDHINGDRSDNRLCNLRDVSRLDNLRNMSMSAHNSSGITGVYRNKHTRRWSAKISVNNRSRHLGYFETAAEAEAARKAAEVELGFNPAHGVRRSSKADARAHVEE